MLRLWHSSVFKRSFCLTRHSTTTFIIVDVPHYCYQNSLTCLYCRKKFTDPTRPCLTLSLDMAKRVRIFWPDPIDPFWLVTRLTRPNPPVLPRLPTLSRLRLSCNFYKIFTYSSLLNMLCTPLYFVILYLPPSFSLPTLNKSKIIPRLASRKLEQELHQIWVSSQVFSGNW